MTNTIELTEELPPWNDPMPGWVCAIGGYEVLTDGTPTIAREWMIRFGMTPHAPIRGGRFLSQELHRFRGATHYGFIWWGHPNQWDYEWPLEWRRMLQDEAIKRDETGTQRLLIRADNTVTAGPRVRRRRK